MANDTDIKLALDPKGIINSLQDVSDETKKLSSTMKDSLGKDAVKAVDSLEKKAENGTAKIKGFFRNLGQTIKEDLKTAFDFGKVMSGLKFGKIAEEGVKQVFDMEKAFAKLNTRLQFTGKTLQDFKRNLGSAVAGAGQSLEDILPGVETASSKGGIKDAKQLTAIGESLAKARGTTGEDTDSLSGSIIEILKHQNKEISAKTFNETLSALQGTRVSGAFHSAGEAGKAIEGMTAGISPAMLKKMGLGTRELGGLASVASKGGDQGQAVMQSILKQASEPGGMQKLNAILGQNIFKGGKFDAKAMGKVDQGRFGQYTEQVMGGATNVDQASLSRLIQSFKTGMPEFDKVVNGTNETAVQFAVASENLGTDIDKFKEGIIDSVRDLGSSLSVAGHDLIKGNFSKLKEDAGNIGSSLMEHKGQLAAGIGLTAGVAVMAGSGIRGLLSKVGGGAGGLAGGVLEGKALEKTAGVTPVFVVNASEISAGSGLPGAGLAGGGALAMLGKIGAVAGAGAIGYEVGSWLNDNTALGSIGEKLYDAMHSDEPQTSPNSAVNGKLNPDDIKKAVLDGTHEGTIKAKETTDKNKKTVYTNPSKYPSTGKPQ